MFFENNAKLQEFITNFANSFGTKSPNMTGKRYFLLLFVLAMTLCADAQDAVLLRQHNMKKWGVPAGNYSGITCIGGNKYALVSDKQASDGWHEVTIDFKESGDIRSMTYNGFRFDETSEGKARDAEGIVFTNEGTIFVAAEQDQRIIEHDISGKKTNCELAIPSVFGTQNIYPNYGFEALAYDRGTGQFWTTTEQGLRSDMPDEAKYPHLHKVDVRLQCFSPHLQPLYQLAYRTDEPETQRNTAFYAYGVPEITVLNDSILLVMERELSVPKGYNNSFCVNKIYMVNVRSASKIDAETSLQVLDNEAFAKKRLLTEFRTTIKYVGKKNFANYEGMCLGPRLADGSQTLLLVADSQNRTGNSLFHLKDYIRVVVIKTGPNNGM